MPQNWWLRSLNHFILSCFYQSIWLEFQTSSANPKGILDSHRLQWHPRPSPAIELGLGPDARTAACKDTEVSITAALGWEMLTLLSAEASYKNYYLSFSLALWTFPNNELNHSLMQKRMKNQYCKSERQTESAEEHIKYLMPLIMSRQGYRQVQGCGT